LTGVSKESGFAFTAGDFAHETAPSFSGTGAASFVSWALVIAARAHEACRTFAHSGASFLHTLAVATACFPIFTKPWAPQSAVFAHKTRHAFVADGADRAVCGRIQVALSMPGADMIRE